MSLKEIVAEAQKSSRPETTSGKTPAYYNRERKLLIDELAANPIVEVRIALASNEHTPAGTLKTMLNCEEESVVMASLVDNPRMPLKAITEFAKSDVAEGLTENDEAYQAIVTRLRVE